MKDIINFAVRTIDRAKEGDYSRESKTTISVPCKLSLCGEILAASRKEVLESCDLLYAIIPGNARGRHKIFNLSDNRLRFSDELKLWLRLNKGCKSFGKLPIKSFIDNKTGGQSHNNWHNHIKKRKHAYATKLRSANIKKRRYKDKILKFLNNPWVVRLGCMAIGAAAYYLWSRIRA